MHEQLEHNLIKFLTARSNTFAWKHEDKIGNDKSIITHKHNIGASFRPLHLAYTRFLEKTMLKHMLCPI